MRAPLFQLLFGNIVVPGSLFVPRPRKLRHRLFHIQLGQAAQYAGSNDLASFVGAYVKPLVPHLTYFWFARYGQAGAREIKFKFSTGCYEKIRKDAEAIENSFVHGQDGCVDYDYEGDLGGSRFLPPGRPEHKAERALGVYQFLTSAARLYVDCLVPDGLGWKLEEEITSGFNRETTMETFHHLFCNMTTVPTWATTLHYPNQGNQLGLMSDLDARPTLQHNPPNHPVTLVQINH
jgi:hypothetical protein